MGLLGKVLSLPVKIINAPLKAIEEIVELPDTISKPLEILAEKLEEVDDDDN